MSLKETLSKISRKDKKEQNNNQENNEIILLDKKIDAFIDWYTDNMVKGYYTEIGEYFEPRQMRYAIDKMTAWYELRYSNNDIKSKMNSCKMTELTSSEAMFKRNPYVIELMSEDSDIECLDWDDFYSFDCFLKELSWDEKWMLLKTRYPDIVYLGKNNKSFNPHFHIDYNGIIVMADDVDTIKVKDSCLCSDDFEGMHIKDALIFLKELDISIDLSEIEQAIKKYDINEYLREEFLNCVMYNIIERGGNRIGPRRGLLFATEFKRDIDIPMKYGVDLSDSYLREFMNEYFKLGGSNDLICIVGYFNRTSDSNKFDTINMQELIKQVKYTDEEKVLHQRFVNTVQRKINENNKVKKLVK